MSPAYVRPLHLEADGRPLCGARSATAQLAGELQEVTCKRCRRQAQPPLPRTPMPIADEWMALGAAIAALDIAEYHRLVTALREKTLPALLEVRDADAKLAELAIGDRAKPMRLPS
jgi:hypothetical protein